MALLAEVYEDTNSLENNLDNFKLTSSTKKRRVLRYDWYFR